MDVQMPDGTLVKDVPDGTTKAELMDKLAKMNAGTQAPAAGTLPAQGSYPPSSSGLVNTLADAGQWIGKRIQQTPLGMIMAGSQAIADPALRAIGTNPQKLAEAAGDLGANIIMPGSPLPGSAAHTFKQNVAAGVASIFPTDPASIAMAAVGARGVKAPETAAVSEAPKPLPVREQTLADGQAVGYVVPPSTMNPSMVNTKLESIGGKGAVSQAAALKNQQVTNNLAAQELGLPKDQPITPMALTDFRTSASEPYRQVALLSDRAAFALEELKKTRNRATKYYHENSINGSVDAWDKAEALMVKAQLYEKQIDKIATESGNPDLLAQLREARQKIAQSYDVEKALNVGSGFVDAHKLGTMLQQGKPLSGNLETIGRFAKAFPSVTREASKVSAPGVSGADVGASAILGTLGFGAAAGPAGLAAAALPLVRGPVRSAILSGPYQRNMMTPGAGISIPTPGGRAAALAALTQMRSLGDQIQSP